MDDSHPYRSMSIDQPIPEISLFQTLTLKLQGQGHECGQRARSYNRPSISLIRFLFISHQSDQQFLRYGCLEIWHSIPDIQQMHFLFISHQSDQPLLGYSAKSVWPWKTYIRMLKENSLHKVFNSISPKSDQVISMIRGINIPSFIVIRWLVGTLSWRQSKYLLITISSFIQTYIFLVQIYNVWHNQFRRQRQNSLQCRTRRRKRTKNIESRQTCVT